MKTITKILLYEDILKRSDILYKLLLKTLTELIIDKNLKFDSDKFFSIILDELNKNIPNEYFSEETIIRVLSKLKNILTLEQKMALGNINSVYEACKDAIIDNSKNKLYNKAELFVSNIIITDEDLYQKCKDYILKVNYESLIPRNEKNSKETAKEMLACEICAEELISMIKDLNSPLCNESLAKIEYSFRIEKQFYTFTEKYHNSIYNIYRFRLIVLYVNFLIYDRVINKHNIPKEKFFIGMDDSHIKRGEEESYFSKIENIFMVDFPGSWTEGGDYQKIYDAFLESINWLFDIKLTQFENDYSLGIKRYKCGAWITVLFGGISVKYHLNHYNNEYSRNSIKEETDR